MKADAAAVQTALEKVLERLYADADGACFERRGDLILSLCPQMPIPQFNAAWVLEDTPAAADALADTIAEIDASGAAPSVQTRTGHERMRSTAAELGLTEIVRMPGMVVRPVELITPPDGGAEIGLVEREEVASATDVMAVSFGMPAELLQAYLAACVSAGGSWYVARVDGVVAATSYALTIDDATGIFNVATAPEFRGRGLGAALTARAAKDGFAAGAEFAFLQASALGHPVYLRLGFRDVEQYALLMRPATS